jgi:hypothetical protein
MKKVTHSLKPRTASARRAVRVRRWALDRTGAATA